MVLVLLGRVTLAHHAPLGRGGEPEMVMAANILRRPITVYRGVEGTVEPVVTYGEELGKGEGVGWGGDIRGGARGVLSFGR